MKVGTKSLLFGVHQVILHPIFVFIAWWKLYGFPYDPRLWVAFIVHDWGYWGKPNMDGEEGETHPEVGAKIMHKLFDKKSFPPYNSTVKLFWHSSPNMEMFFVWYDFTLYHSRFYAKRNNAQISRLCVADKYAFCVYPRWLYMVLVQLTGELTEYMTESRIRELEPIATNKQEWYDRIYNHTIKWVKENKDIIK